MREAPEFCLNRADVVELANHLKHCDAGFMPPLSARVDIDAYAQKLSDKAMRFEAWYAGALVGLVAAYCNDPTKRAAFVTSVSVIPVWKGQGIAARLLAWCLTHVGREGYAVIELEVDKHNQAAVALYQKYGFFTTKTCRTLLIMNLALGN